MTGLRILSAAALLAAVIATPAMAQQAMQEPGAYLQDHPWATKWLLLWLPAFRLLAG